MLKINQLNQVIVDFCGYVLSIDKNLIIVDANAHHIDIEKTVLDIDDTDVLTELQLGKLGDQITADSAAIASSKKHVMLFTSGSTGQPKCIKLTPAKVMQSAMDFCLWFNIGSRSKVLCLAPISTMTGLRTHLFMPMISECQMSLFCEGDASIFDYLAIIEKEAVTHIIVGPPFVRMLAVIAKRIAPSQLVSLQYILCTGANLSQQDVAIIQQYFPIQVLNYYGLTETYGFCIAQGVNDPCLIDGGIGKAVNGVELQIRQPDSEGIGCLTVKSERLFSGYLGREEGEITEFDTGDLASISACGTVVLHGRADEAIKLTSTELVYPYDIERLLKACAYIDDVAVSKHTEGWQASIESSLDKAQLLEKMKTDLDKKYIPPHFSVSTCLQRTALGKLPQALLKD
ncbi:fatty acid--CoA ligase family protein [Shewanella sp. Scap07]|uniref:ANL family adenylate-forming protein n=1 Tax=Shewanella sp. Scap07 TaxID=2589987 RepID=UPI0015BA76FB|nr:fatty acid--CoA ligase family protein [Shewanella sp. Scap07]